MPVAGWLLTLIDGARGAFHTVAEVAFQITFVVVLAVALWWLFRPLVWLGNRLTATTWWTRRFGHRYSGGDLVGIALAALWIGGPIVVGIALYAVGIFPVR